MADYDRTTRSFDLANIPSDVLADMRRVAERFGAGGFEADVRACCETRSTKKKKGFFGSFGSGDPDPEHTTLAVLTTRWLIWSRRGSKSGIVTSMAALKEIALEDFAAARLGDHGLEVFGFVNGSTEKVHAFIGLGRDPDGLDFKKAVESALA